MKRVYLFLTALFLAASLGTGFAMQNRVLYVQSAMQTLETAKLQLSKVSPDKGGHIAKAVALITQAEKELNTVATTDDTGT